MSRSRSSIQNVEYIFRSNWETRAQGQDQGHASAVWLKGNLVTSLLTSLPVAHSSKSTCFNLLSIHSNPPEHRLTQLSTTSKAEMLTSRYVRDRCTEITQVLWCHAMWTFVDVDAQSVFDAVSGIQPMKIVVSDVCVRPRSNFRVLVTTRAYSVHDVWACLSVVVFSSSITTVTKKLLMLLLPLLLALM